MSQLAWFWLAVLTYVAWFASGFGWLFRRKLALLRRFPGSTNDDLIRIAKGGDAEAQRLRRDTWRFIAAGFLLGGALAVVRFTVVHG